MPDFFANSLEHLVQFSQEVKNIIGHVSQETSAAMQHMVSTYNADVDSSTQVEGAQREALNDLINEATRKHDADEISDKEYNDLLVHYQQISREISVNASAARSMAEEYLHREVRASAVNALENAAKEIDNAVKGQ